MADWFTELAHYFFDRTRWPDASDRGGPPRALLEELRVALGPEYTPDLVYPLDYEDHRVAFLAFDGEDSAILVRFEPPSTTTVTHLGALTGGVYAESVRYYGDEMSATFSHERLDAPFHVTLRPPADALDHPEGSEASFRRSDLLRERLRRWATAPHVPAT